MSEIKEKNKKDSISFCGAIISKFPVLIKAENKHGDLYYFAKSSNGVKKAALEIVKYRKEYCDFYIKNDVPHKFEEYFNKKHDFTLEHFEKMVEMMNETAKSARFNDSTIPLSEYVNFQKKRYSEDIINNKVHYAANKAVSEEDAELSVKILNTTFGWCGNGIIIETDISEFL